MTPIRLFAAVLALTILAAPAPAASPTDEALRVAPPDAALVLVVRNARDHARHLTESPFGVWFPNSALGRQLLATEPVKKFRESAGGVLAELGVTFDDLLNDVLGDAVVFAFTPGTGDPPKGEQAVVLIRPRNPDLMAKLIDRVNAAQTKGGELKAVSRRDHGGAAYFEREKTNGPAEFYAFVGPVFAFSGSEADLKAVIDRHAALPPAEKASTLAARIAKLGLTDSAAVLLVNPRALDAELKAKVAGAKPDEKAFLTHFQEAWLALDAAAVFLNLGADLELGVATSFRPEALPATARDWLVGPKTPSGLWAAVPENALAAVAARFKAADLIATISSLLPDDGKNAIKAAVADTLGPVVGRDKLRPVLDALGPDWAVWAEPPRPGAGFLPVVVGVVQVQGDETAAKAIRDALAFGFQTARVAYNVTHPDQVELREEKDGDAVITSLVNDTGFPPGFRPAFALKGGYLVLATSTDAIKAFRPPVSKPAVPGEAVLARFSATATRDYLQTHGGKLAAFLAGFGAGDEKELRGLFDQFGVVLEPLDRVELVARGDATGLRLSLRAKFVKSLKK